MSDAPAATEALRLAHESFTSLIAAIRPELHRYCSRMTGSVLDGEDLVQESLAQAFYALGMLRQEVPLRPWLFTIAHHKCVDFLRSRGARPTVDLDERNEPVTEIDTEIEDRELAGVAFSRLVLVLPPRERASVLLKDVLGYSLPEIAKILETSVGAVKASLHRGREKLDGLADEAIAHPSPIPAEVSHYIEAFNRRDWASLESFIAEGVQCELVGFAHLVGRDALENSYCATYAKQLTYPWKLAAGEVDGEPALVCLRQDAGKWSPRHAIRLEWQGGRVTRIRDYAHVSYLFREGRVVFDPPTEP